MKTNFLFISFFIFTSLVYSQESDKNSVSDSLTCQHKIQMLHLQLLEKDIEIAKTRRTLGWVIAAPSVFYTVLGTTLTILSPPTPEDESWYPIIGSVIITGVLSYVGIDMIIDSSKELSGLEEKKASFGVNYQPASKTFMVGLQVGL